MLLFFYRDATAPTGPRSPNYRGSKITLRHETLGRTPLNERSARRRDLYLTTHSTHDRHLCPWQDSNSQYQQVSGLRPTP